MEREPDFSLSSVSAHWVTLGYIHRDFSLSHTNIPAPLSLWCIWGQEGGGVDKMIFRSFPSEKLKNLKKPTGKKNQVDL